jgi:hypothetical protein
MVIRIGHASIDENGNVAGGKVGDQTKKEICTRLWYDKDWDYYMECTDSVIANKAAKFVEQVCADPNYGYDQSGRLTGYGNIAKNGGKVSGAKGEFDCSSLIAAAYIFAGLKLSPACTTRNLRSALFATDKFKVYSEGRYLTSDRYAKRGGIYLSEGHHVVMALENGAGANTSGNSSNIYTVRSGDNLTKIAIANHTTVDKLVALNNIKNPNNISIGQRIKLK